MIVLNLFVALYASIIFRTVFLPSSHLSGRVEQVVVEELDQVVRLEEEEWVELAEIVLAMSRSEFQVNASSSTGLRKSPNGYPCPIIDLCLKVVRSGTLPCLPRMYSSVYSHMIFDCLRLYVQSLLATQFACSLL